MQSERVSPSAWLEGQPLESTEQLFVVFSSASAAEPFNVWRRLNPSQAPHPIWAGTAYAEWEAVMPYVGVVAAGSEFLDWAASTEAPDWGWLAVSSASLEVMVEHLRSLTQVLLANGDVVFFRFWDGRYLLPILQADEVDTAQLMPVIGRCLINGQALELGGAALATGKTFPWWEVSPTLLKTLACESIDTHVNNLLLWLGEDHPDLFEAFSDSVLRHKIVMFLGAPGLPQAPKSALVDYLMAELN